MNNKVLFNLSVASPTFIATADLHIGKKLYNTPELAEDLLNNLVRVADIAIDKKVQYLVIAGDLFEDNLPKPNTIGFIINQIDRLKQHNITTVGIAGDHDKPIKNNTWCRISKVEPVTIEPAFTGIDYFDYATTDSENIIKLLKDGRDCSKVLWIFLHCSFPQLFARAEPKKIIDYNKLDIFKNFPSIQGIIAGDIHSGPETKAYGVNHEAYVGYTGSLGITDKSEYKHHKRVIWCNGKKLIQVPFPSLRISKDIDFRNEKVDKVDVGEIVSWAKGLDVKPMVYLHYDADSEKLLKKFEPLYKHALIALNKVPIGVTNLDDNTAIFSRSESSTDDKIEKALRYHCDKDEELYKLASALLKDDPKDVLDKLKKDYELTQTRILET